MHSPATLSIPGFGHQVPPSKTIHPRIGTTRSAIWTIHSRTASICSVHSLHLKTTGLLWNTSFYSSPWFLCHGERPPSRVASILFPLIILRMDPFQTRWTLPSRMPRAISGQPPRMDCNALMEASTEFSGTTRRIPIHYLRTRFGGSALTIKKIYGYYLPMEKSEYLIHRTLPGLEALQK